MSNATHKRLRKEEERKKERKKEKKKIIIRPELSGKSGGGFSISRLF